MSELTYRPATLDDVELAADLMSAAYPDLPEDPDFRGRGLAQAIKLQSLAQAVELGIPRVIADNDSENAPMLRINEKLGYRLRPGFVGHLKRVDNGSDA